MKQRLQGLIAGILVGLLCAGGAVYAKTGTQTIDVLYDNIKIFLDGEEIEPKDADGQTVEPFVYNGTTYLPVRAVGNAIGKEVSWDGVEKIVYLGAKPGGTENWLNVCGPYQYQRADEYRLEDNKFFTMSGKKYTNGFVCKDIIADEGYEAWALFNLNGQYDSLTFTVGHVDGTPAINATMNIYLDGVIAYTKELKYDDVAKSVTIPLNYALQMKIEVTDGNWVNRPSYGFSEGVFK